MNGLGMPVAAPAPAGGANSRLIAIADSSEVVFMAASIFAVGHGSG
jgi:hypothetical protein